MKWLLAATFALLASAASAQERAVVVDTCGTPPGTYVAGASRPILQNTDGQVCTSATGGGGGGDASAANQDEQTTELQEIEADVEATETAVDGLEALVGTTNTNTGNSATSLGTLDNAIAGNEMQVDIVTLPSVTLANIGSGEKETIAASQTAQALGATGGTGDYLMHLVCAPATTSPGVVTILDNGVANVSFAGGASSVSNLVPFTIPVNAFSAAGAWTVTTGANISCLAVGNFT